MTTERFNCFFPQYPEEVQIATKRKAKYWRKEKEDSLPPANFPKYLQKGLDDGKYIWGKKGKSLFGGTAYALYDTKEKSFVIKNKALAGTPRFQVINSQVVWESGSGSEWTIRRVKDFLKAWFKPGIVRQLPEKIFTPSRNLFIHFEYIFYYPFELREPRTYQDYINHWFIRGKIFEDTLVSMGVIMDDSPQFVRGGYGRYVNVDTEEDRKLEVKIHFCKNGQRIC